MSEVKLPLPAGQPALVEGHCHHYALTNIPLPVLEFGQDTALAPCSNMSWPT